MENNIKLPELKNLVTVEGVLKSKRLEERKSRNGKNYIKGDLVILVASETEENENGEKVFNEVPVELFTMEGHGLHQNSITIKNEYKTIDDVGFNQADRVKIQANIIKNEYYNKDGALVQFNKVRGVFFNRLTGEELSNMRPRATAEIGIVVRGFEEEISSEELPTGDYKVDCLSVGYGSEVIPLFEVVVGKDLYEDMKNLYPKGTAATVHLDINNLVYVKEEEKEAEEVGFGEKRESSAQIIRRYESNYRVVSGNLPYTGDKAFTNEMLNELGRLRKLQLAALKEQYEATNIPEEQGFGQNQVLNNNLEGLSGGGIPDF